MQHFVFLNIVNDRKEIVSFCGISIYFDFVRSYLLPSFVFRGLSFMTFGGYTGQFIEFEYYLKAKINTDSKIEGI
jgi:hypothetical protein